jgi:hypothetical protein
VAQASRRLVSVAVLAAVALQPGLPLFGQAAGAAFTYQGRLTDNGTAVTGPFDFQCVLYSAAVGGAQVGPIVTLNDVAVANGLFTVNLDFGAAAFAGSVRFLEIGVRPGASTGAYAVLGARQEIKPAPHSVFAQAAPWAGIAGKPVGFADDVDNDSGGDITSVTVGTGLTGGGAAGAVSLGLDFPAVALNHNHFGQTWNGGQTSGLDINNSAVNGVGMRVVATATTGLGVGVLAGSNAASGIGIDGGASGTGLAIGVRGTTGSTAGRGISGLALASTGLTIGVYGSTDSNVGTGILGEALHTSTQLKYGVRGVVHGANGIGVRGLSLATSGATFGVAGDIFTTGGSGVAGISNGTTGSASGLRGTSDSSAGFGVWASAPITPTAFAGHFSGHVNVTGTLSKSAGSFKIDHPLDPENKYLYHSFVESPDMMNVYNGVVVTDADGFATVELPEWFEALNRDFRYQLTVVDEGDTTGFVQVKVVRKVAGNRFQVRASAPGVEVSWQVTGIRKDTYAEKHRVPVEQEKPAEERGRYIQPADWGLPPERGVDWPQRQLHVNRALPATSEN